MDDGPHTREELLRVLNEVLRRSRAASLSGAPPMETLGDLVFRFRALVTQVENGEVGLRSSTELLRQTEASVHALREECHDLHVRLHEPPVAMLAEETWPD